MRSCWYERAAQWYMEDMPMESLSVNMSVCILLICAVCNKRWWDNVSLHRAGHVVMAAVYRLAQRCNWMVKSSP